MSAAASAPAPGAYPSTTPLDLERFLAIPANEHPRVRIVGELDADFGFEADRLILVGGALTTAERFARFTESLAHIFDDGRVMRYGRQIGDVSMFELLSSSDHGVKQ